MDRNEERKQLHAAFRLCEQLFTKNYTRFEYNMEQTTRMISTPWQYKHLYCWLGDRTGYNEKVVDAIPCMKKEDCVMEEYPDFMEVDTYQNGSKETIIHVRNTRMECISEEDEKCSL